LDIQGASNAAGTKLIVWPRLAQDNQMFRFRNGMLECKNGLVLDVEGGMVKGNNIIQWKPHGGANQRWKLFADGTIRLESGALVMDIQGGSTQQGAHVIAWSHHGKSNQKWRLVKC